ncbi:MAG TPA: hypothetical protein VL200_12480 [Lacunisphaera sp.]|jgi:hypothetical protein|nr:hypothetical protein [Lacunisphaera sp.]
MKSHPVRLLLAGLGLLAATMSAQSTPPQPPPPPPEARQFDFWIGAWDVTAPNGKQVGSSRIELIAKGNGLLENWTGAGGGEGKSLNCYNAARKQWQQFWVGNGGVLELAGGLVDGSMVMSGEHTVGGTPTIERITWTPLPDGVVRQHWEQSTDGGKTWTTAFDGRYHKKAG